MARGPVKLPWMPLYGKEWRTDAKLRSCAPETRAWWLDLCLVMWDDQVHTTSGTVVQLARMVGASPVEMAAVLLDLHTTGTATIAPPVKEIAQDGVTFSVTSRRLKRMLAVKKSSAKRVKKHRDLVSNADATAKRGASNGVESESDVRDHKETDVRSSAREPLTVGGWNAGVLRALWERVTQKSGMAAGTVLQDVAALVADSARVLGAEPAAHAEALIRALPRVIAQQKRQGLATPALSLNTFLDARHFSRCEDVVKGTLDPDAAETPRPARAADRPRAIGRATPRAPSIDADTVTWEKPGDIK